MIIERIKDEEIAIAGDLIKIIFDEFSAPEFTEHGSSYFYEITSTASIRERYLNNSLILVAKKDDSIAGYIETINLNHIYLLFVDKEFHNKGIAGKLLYYTQKIITDNNPDINEMTVNSTSFAVKIYEKMGFEKIADYQFKNGIMSYPMKIAF